MVRKTTKKILCTLMVVVMCLASVPLGGLVNLKLPKLDWGIKVSAATYSGYCGSNVRWSLNTDTGVLSLTGSGYTYDYGWSTLWSSEIRPKPWSKYESYIKTINIGNNITKLGDYLFYDLDNLETVNLSEYIEYIGNGTFAGCGSLKTVNFPEHLLYIGNGAFSGCPITNIEFTSSIEEIGEYAFSRNKCKEIVVPKDAYIGKGAFAYSTIEKLIIKSYDADNIYNAIYGCSSLKEIRIESLHLWTNIQWSYYDKFLASGVKLYYNDTLLTDIMSNNQYIAAINNYAFYGYNWVTNVNLSESVKYVGHYSFSGCKNIVKAVSKARYIGQNAFADCSNLMEAVVENGEIDANAFENCTKLQAVELLDHVEEIGYGVFNGCTNIKTIKISNADCIICDSSNVFPVNATIYGWKNSTAERYATKYNRKFVALDNLCEHEYAVITNQESTCTSNGYIISQCSKCGYVEVDTKSAKGHDYIENGIVLSPTCTAIGLKSEKCSVCHEEKFTIVEATGHKEITLDAVEATCVKEGLTEGKKCMVCDEILVEQATIKPTGHSYTSSVTEQPTHTEEGETTYTCACGDSYTEPIEKLTGHSYTSEVTKEATHTEEGETTYTCACGDTYTEPIEKLTGHTYTSEVTKEAAHTEEGETTYTCACGDTYTEPIEKIKDHTYTSEVTKEATHTEEGETTYTCACGDTYTESIEKIKEHTYTSEITKQPTYKEEGVMTYTCECGDTYTESIDKLADHVYVAEVTVKATCTQYGKVKYTCVCGDSYTESIPATGHTFSGSTCTVCGYDRSDSCSCNCHASGIARFFFVIVNFFQKLFGNNKVCNCGAAH